MHGFAKTLRGMAAVGAVTAATVAAAASPAIAQGCAMCATALGADDPLARGLNISILFMLSMPFVLLVTVGSWFLYMYRRGRRHAPVVRVLRSQKEGIP